jgi:hypothetical protein
VEGEGAPSEAPSSSLITGSTCQTPSTNSPIPVELGSACNYVILAKSGISTVAPSAITGDIGVAPIAATAITGFGLTLDSSTQFSTASQITGKAFAVDYGVPTPATLTTAVGDMQKAYDDAAGRPTDASRENIGDGTISGQTFSPGVYTFTSGLTIATDISFEGGPDDVFIIQITGNLIQAANTQVLLLGCVKTKNIFWQVTGFVEIRANASMQGIILGAGVRIDFLSGSSLVGSALSLFAVNLIKATLTQADCTCTGSLCLTAVPSAAPSRVPLPTPSEAPNSCPASSPSSPAPVDLESACNYAILTKSGISTVPSSDVTGNIAVSPIDSGSITGFTLILDSSGQFSTSTQVTGKAFADNYSSPIPGELSVAVLDLEAAYTNASQRTATSSLVDGAIGGLTLTTGVYTFTAGITITSDLTFEGGLDDVFIIQTAGTLTQAANTQVILSGCVQAKNIFWQVADFIWIGTDASMQGILLAQTKVDFITGSSLVGRVLAQTAVSLGMAKITQAPGTCT